MTTVGWTARRIAAAVHRGDVTAEDVAEAHLAAAADAEGRLHAWAHLDAAAALDAARAVDTDPAAAGPLAGVPIGVKDLIDVAGMPTGNGAAIPVGAATRDAEVVARLRAAGAVVLGKTVTAEYALHQPGPTVNPHDPTRTPGGSSSGSAAAVAAGVIPLALGTQTAGSVVRPAAYCGVYGAKPTRGVVSCDGVTPCAPSLDTVGILGHDAGDLALALEVMGVAGATGGGRSRPRRLGFFRGPAWAEVQPACGRVIEDAVERLAGELEVIEVATPPAMTGLAAAQRVIGAVECAASLEEVRRRHGDLLSEATHRAARVGEDHRWAYAAACAHADQAQAARAELFADVDVLVAPSALGEAPPVVGTGDPLPCRDWTVLGVPTVAVPGLRGPGGLPLGVQVVADVGDDAAALAAAAVVGGILDVSPHGPA